MSQIRIETDGIGELIKSVHSLFGFIVKESIVVLYVDGQHSVSARLRINLDSMVYSNATQVAKKMFEPDKHVGIIVIAYSENMTSAYTGLLEFLTKLLETDVPIHEAVYTDNQNLWESFAGYGGYLDFTPSNIELEMASRGKFNYASREEAIESVGKTEPVPEIENIVEQFFAQCPLSGEGMKAWRQTMLHHKGLHQTGDEFLEGVAALIICGSDIILRNYMLKTLLAVSHASNAHTQIIHQAFSKTPEKYVPLVAEIFAWATLCDGSMWMFWEIIKYCDVNSTNRNRMISLALGNITMEIAILTMNFEEGDNKIFQPFLPVNENIIGYP